MNISGDNEDTNIGHQNNSKNQRGDIIYSLEERVPFGRRLVYSLQYVFIFIGSIVLVPVIISSPLGWDDERVAYIIQCAIFTGGIATFVQTKGIGPVGARLPILLGTTFVIINPIIIITLEYGYDSFIGAVVVGGVIYAILGYFGYEILVRIFSHTVTGTVIVTIALTLAPYCATMMAGGDKPIGSGYNSIENWLLATLCFCICLVCHCFGNKTFKSASLFLGIFIGYVVSLGVGFVDYSNVHLANWISVPMPLHYGISFQLQPILIMVVVYIVTAVEFIGDTTATAMVCENRLPTKNELRGGILCDALSSILSGIFNFAPNISYSDSVGIIGTTRVASRSVMITSAIIITVAGIIPKLACILCTIPMAVLGGVCMFLTGIMIMAGFDVILTQPLNLRNSVIVGTSLAIGVGFGLSNVFESAPVIINVLFSGIPGAALTGGFLNTVLPKT